MNVAQEFYKIPRNWRVVLFIFLCAGLGLAWGIYELTMPVLMLSFVGIYVVLLLPDVMASQAGRLVRIGRVDEGIRLCKRALKLEPGSYLASVNLGFGYYKKGLAAEAVETFDEVVKNYPDKHIAYINRAASRFLLHDYEGSIADADKSIQLAPHDTRAYVNKSAALIGQHRYEECLALLENMRTLRQHPDYVAHNRMFCKAQLSRLDEAEQEWLQAKVTDPHLTHLGKVWLTFEKSDFSEVLAQSAEIRDDSADAKVYRYLRSCAYTCLGEGDLAVREAFQLLADQPQSKLGLIALALAFAKAQMTSETLKLCDRLDAFDDFSIITHLTRALFFIENADFENASGELQKGLSKCPTSAALSAAQVIVQANQGEGQEALLKAKRLVKANTKNSLCWTALAEAYLACEQLEAALESIEKSKDLYSYSPHIFARKAHILARLGRKEDAARVEAEGRRLQEYFQTGVNRALLDYPVNLIEAISQLPKKRAAGVKHVEA
ncbi:MAG: tetratricopeptide repeat protein [Cyanobacteria bacterium REEB67]|nr:tetratricopeptide repeat protein [Cyanobacteria bacterium REEB67]